MTAILWCETCGPALHRFTMQRRRITQGGTLLGYDQHYSCTRCQATRKWGYTAKPMDMVRA